MKTIHVQKKSLRFREFFGRIECFFYKIRSVSSQHNIYIESNTSKSARQGNLRHPRVRFQSFANEARRVSQRLKSYPRVSEISLSCTFCRCLILFLTFISCFQFRVCLCTFSRRSCKQCELFTLHVNQKSSSVFVCIA